MVFVLRNNVTRIKTIVLRNIFTTTLVQRSSQETNAAIYASIFNSKLVYLENICIQLLQLILLTKLKLKVNFIKQLYCFYPNLYIIYVFNNVTTPFTINKYFLENFQLEER